jgi:HAD superfamily hydrolase (TIGR01490 family)
MNDAISAPSPILALFDLDHTLLPIDSDYTWGQFLVTQGAVSSNQFTLDNQRLMDSYNAGTLTAEESLPILLAPLAAHSKEQLDLWHQLFMKTHIIPNLLPSAYAVLSHHLTQGHTVLIVTATNRFVTEPIAAAFGIDSTHLIATEPEQIDNQFTGRWIDTPSFKEGKVIRVKAWLNERGLSLNSFKETWFYSDSMNDLPLLKEVTHPVACNPSPSLESHAIKHGWRIQKLW